MRTYLDCYSCFIKQALECSRMSSRSEKTHKKIMDRVMGYLQSISFNLSPPAIAREVYGIIREETGENDPYRDIKKRDNENMLGIVSGLKEIVNRSEEPLFQSCKLAIAGNQIDSGAGTRKENHGHSDIEEVLRTDPAVNHFKYLKEDLSAAKTLLYIGDNAGEIVIDRIFIEEIQKKYPGLKITFSVRGGPVINDITYEDAETCSIPEICDVIDNGDNSPGTDLQCCSEKFKKYFNDSDVVIAKGQGNYETLSGVKKSALYFLLMAKCNMVATHLNCSVGSTLIKKNGLPEESRPVDKHKKE